MISYTAKHWIIFPLILLPIAFHYATAQSSFKNPNGFHNLTPFAMYAIVASLALTLILMLFFYVYTRNYNVSTTTNTLTATCGLDASVIEKFPTFAYSTAEELKIGKGTVECAVCLCEFEGEETLRLIPKCDHVFHADCIDKWLASHETCPVCRANLTPQPDDPAIRSGDLGQTGMDFEGQNDPAELEQEPENAGRNDVGGIVPGALDGNPTH